MTRPTVAVLLAILFPYWFISRPGSCLVPPPNPPIFYSSASVERDFLKFRPEEAPATPLQGWTRWSEWSACTRKCGGEGVQYQLRRCLDLYCSGPSSRHRICGKEECASWPHVGASAASVECSLRSTAYEPLVAPTVASEDCSVLHCVNGRTDLLLRTFNISLRDGSKCQIRSEPAQPAACLAGKCRPVGCDDLIGSRQRADQCGVCGGDGTSCARELFRWRDTGHFSPCDQTCGPNGVRVSVSVCVNTHMERVVPERMCADQRRPRPQVRRCAHVVCPAKPHPSAPLTVPKHGWLTGDWGDCSTTCGGNGEQRREVFCAEIEGEGQKGAEIEGEGQKGAENRERHRVADEYCAMAEKPIDVRKCWDGECPGWVIGEWGDCSASCGRGVRRRPVECRRGDAPFHPFYCMSDGGKRPPHEQPCWTGIPCPTARNPEQGPAQHLISYGEADGGGDLLPDEKPRFVAGPWGDCSAPCGAGIRHRLVECVAGGDGGAQHVLRLPDYECQGQSKPAEFQPCQLALCPATANKSPPVRSLADPFGGPPSGSDSGGFHWEHGDWTACSASCLGGKQKAPVLCMNTARATAAVDAARCDAARRPQELTRACNRHACPPDWEIGPWSACSHLCGAGVRTRRVRCARAVSRTGAARVLIVPDAQCPGARPGDEEPCGMVDCDPEWLAGQWGQCSTSCGPGGEQRRAVRCVRRDSLGELLEARDAQCRADLRPASVRLCNLGPCPSSHAVFSYEEGVDRLPSPMPESLALMKSKDEPLLTEEETEDGEGEVEHHNHHRKLTLKVGGYANLYEGTSVKVKCPVKGGGNSVNRRRVVWSRDGRRVENTPHVKVSANGALRIFHARMADAGVYACHTRDGQLQGNVTLRFKPAAGVEQGEPSPRRIDKNRTTKQEQRESRKGMELLQRVRDSLARADERALLRRLHTVSDPAQVRVQFAPSEWSACRQPDEECGRGEGVQVRLLKCQIHVGPDWAHVEEAICDAFGVPRPPASRPCTDPRCPRWHSGEWSECAESRCVRHATALQRRDVHCAFANGTRASDAAQCDRRARPKLKRECENANCSAEWRPSVWGHCSKQCGDGGVQMRLLRCVWHGTRKPAGRQCESALRPAAIRACDAARARALPPCEEEERDNGTEKNAPARPPSAAALHGICEDHSRFCDILRLFQTCDQPQIRARCCFSCRRYGDINRMKTASERSHG